MMRVTIEREGYSEGVQHKIVITLPDDITWTHYMDLIMPELLKDYIIDKEKFLSFCEASTQDWIRE